jgi:hypothetical protein
MKKILLLIACVLIGITSFSKHKNKKKQGLNEIISVKMNRTGCYGKCPTYSIEINCDGSLIYIGQRFTTDTGQFKKTIGKNAALEIINQFVSWRVDTCLERYPNRIPDLPGIFYAIRYQDTTKFIYNANWGPGYLKLLASKMDKLGMKTDSTGWEKLNSPKNK